MAAQHIYGVDLMIPQFISPSGQVTAILIFNGIQHQPRQEEIIGHVAFICHCLVNFFAVRCMNFRQQLQTIFIRQYLYFVQQLPSSRVVQKVFLSRFLGGIGKGIQPHNGCSISSQCLQGIAVELPHYGAFYVQVHLPQVFTVFLQPIDHNRFAGCIFTKVDFIRLLARIQCCSQH